MKIGPSERDFYDENGYLVVEDVLPPEDLEALRGRSDRWVEDSRQVSANDDVFDLEPGHGAEDPKVRRVKEPAGTDDTFGKVMRGTAVLDEVEALIGHDIRFLGSKLNMKAAGVGSPVEWHQDWGFYPHTNDDLLAVGIPLDDMTLENGCLLVIPGSHRGPVLDHNANGRFVGAVEPALIDPSEAVALEAPAGSITLHHVRLLHGSAPNHSGRQRRLYLISYCAGDAWPLTAMPTWDGFIAQMVRGEAALTPRMEKLPVRLPYPVPPREGSIYEVQLNEPTRHSTFAGVGEKRQ